MAPFLLAQVYTKSALTRSANINVALAPVVDNRLSVASYWDPL